jgi:hypothetical protein
LLGKLPVVTFTPPRYVELPAAGGMEAIRSEVNGSASLAKSFQAMTSPAAILMAEPMPLRLEAFDKASPFGPQQTHAFLLSHLSPVGPEARKRFAQCLARSDIHCLMDGGQMLLLGQEDHTRRFLSTLVQLPAQSFEDVPAASDDARTQPLVLRRWTDERATWLYLVNDSCWPVEAEVDLASNTSLRLEMLGADRKMLEATHSGTVARWRVSLEPYDLMAVRIARPQVRVASWRAKNDRSVEAALREMVRETRLRANTLRSPPPLLHLVNDSFEQPAEVGRPLPGWTAADGAGITVEVDRTRARTGESSLRLASEAPRAGEEPAVAWVRSDPFAPPATGRLAIWAWLKVSDPARQPKLRLAIEGRLDGQTYYRRANVGASEDGRATQPLTQEWSPFLFPVDDLPLSGLTDLKVGFDLMEGGEVWIDDVQIFDLWFQDPERDSLLLSIALADFQVQEGMLGDAHAFLESHWPQFLRRHVPLDEARLAAAPQRTISAPPTARNAEAPAASPPARNGMFDGMRRWVPRLPFNK